MQGPFNFSQTSIEQNVSDKPGVYVLLYEGKRVGQDHSDNVREKLLSIFKPAGSRRTARRSGRTGCAALRLCGSSCSLNPLRI